MGSVLFRTFLRTGIGEFKYSTINGIVQASTVRAPVPETLVLQRSDQPRCGVFNLIELAEEGDEGVVDQVLSVGDRNAEPAQDRTDLRESLGDDALDYL